MQKKTLFIALLLTGGALASCQPGSGSASGNGDDTTAQAAGDASAASAAAGQNQLSDQEKSDGWQLLFNGQNLDGWRGYKNGATTAWEAMNGTLHCDGHKKDAPAVDLITNDEYQSFELSLAWKISPASNSGIMFHVNEKYPTSSVSGPEFQIIDDEGWPGKLEDWQHTGCNYAMQLPTSRPVKAVGEWNTTRIVVNGAHVEHWLNGEKILEYEMWSPEWEKQKASGKWKDHPEYGMSKSGHIALQYHGGDVWFRDIKLKKL
ncbi:DUF1080 domain-containing protein [Compostibacter hankyongensis]|uniref:DUF1080 domain-containing protein n=1 Tax=Compostibacter hankyongensis TaxID=1007089 RepID=A0ABP8G0V4_9BACT